MRPFITDEFWHSCADIHIASIAVVGGGLHQGRLLAVIQGNLLHVIKGKLSQVYLSVLCVAQLYAVIIYT